MSQSTQEKLKQSMSSEQRKAKYRVLLDRAEILQENEETGFSTTTEIDDILKSANHLFKDSNIKERIKHTDEVLLDAKVVATTSDVLLFVTEAIDCTLDTYEHVEFARKIRSKLLVTDESETDLNWQAVHEISKRIINLPPNFTFLYGPIGTPNAEPKPEKARIVKTKVKRNEQVAKKEPEKVTDIAKEEDSVDDTVKFLQWCLTAEFEENGGEPVNYFQFIVDPNDFTHTIENSFHLSFLVRDGRVKITSKAGGEFYIYPMSSHEIKKAKKEKVPYSQHIISIDMDDWEEAIKNFEITNCFLDKWKDKWETRKKKS